MAARLPFAGTVVGLLTAVTAPLLWPSMIDLCWEDSLKQLVLGKQELVKKTPLNSNWLMDTYWNYGMPVGVPVGVRRCHHAHGLEASSSGHTRCRVEDEVTTFSSWCDSSKLLLYFSYFKSEEATGGGKVE